MRQMTQLADPQVTVQWRPFLRFEFFEESPYVLGDVTRIWHDLGSLIAYQVMVDWADRERKREPARYQDRSSWEGRRLAAFQEVSNKVYNIPLERVRLASPLEVVLEVSAGISMGTGFLTFSINRVINTYKHFLEAKASAAESKYATATFEVAQRSLVLRLAIEDEHFLYEMGVIEAAARALERVSEIEETETP